MPGADERIEQFRKMTEVYSDNELGHFSLGRAFLQADRAAEAVASLQRAIDINPQMSAAYQFLARAQVQVGNREDAIETLHRGQVVAHRHGDVVPAKAMAKMLRELGEAVPETEPEARAGGRRGGTDDFRCRRCGGGERMAEAPMRGELGQEVFASVCADCWREWLHVGTRVINELRLDFRDADAQATYDEHMKDFLRL